MNPTDEKSGVSELGAGSPERERLREEPLANLVSKLSSDVGLLAKQEIALAKQEAAEKLTLVKAEAVGLTVGVVLMHGAVLALLATLILALAQVLPSWLAALVASIGLALAGGALLVRVKNRLAGIDFGPKVVLASVKRDVSAVKEAGR